MIFYQMYYAKTQAIHHAIIARNRHFGPVRRKFIQQPCKIKCYVLNKYLDTNMSTFTENMVKT